MDFDLPRLLDRYRDALIDAALRECHSVAGHAAGKLGLNGHMLRRHLRGRKGGR